MRIDKYLKVSRLIKRRTVANEACDNGRVSVNGKPVKASYDVKVSDVIEICFGTRTLKIKTRRTLCMRKCADFYIRQINLRIKLAGDKYTLLKSTGGHLCSLKIKMYREIFRKTL